MAEDQPKKKRRRRGRRGRRRGQQQQRPQQKNVSGVYDQEAEKKEMVALEEQRKKTERSVENILDELLPMILPKRDMEVLDWLITATGSQRSALIIQILRGAIVKERRAYREAKGGGGASSTDAEALAARLPAR